MNFFNFPFFPSLNGEMQNTMNVDRNARLSPPFHIFPLMKTIQEANSLSCHSNESNNNSTCSSESYNNLKMSIKMEITVATLFQ